MSLLQSGRPTRLALSSLSLMFLIFAGYAVSAEKMPALNLPPPAQLHYVIRADIKGLTVEGKGFIDWDGNRQSYRLLSETRTALTGILLSEKSEGSVDRSGFAPTSFSSKRFRTESVATYFDRKAGKIQFPGDGPPQVLRGGEQDRLSVLWQLLCLARTSPARFTPGSQWTFFVLGQQDGEDWMFEVKDRQPLRTPLGELDALHVVRVPAENSNSPRMDIWFAPALEWFPARLRLTETNGDYIEQSLEKMDKK